MVKPLAKKRKQLAVSRFLKQRVQIGVKADNLEKTH